MQDNKITIEELENKLNKVSQEEKIDSIEELEPPKSDCEYKNRDIEEDALRQDIQLKERYAKHVIVITYGWLILLAALFILAGISNWRQGRAFLSDSVLIALISGTSLSVLIGLFSIVLKYLFPKK